MSPTKSLFLAWLVATALLPRPLLAVEPARLAVLADSDRERTAADRLTVELSHAQPFQVLERNEIERLLREQAPLLRNRRAGPRRTKGKRPVSLDGVLSQA